MTTTTTTTMTTTTNMTTTTTTTTTTATTTNTTTATVTCDGHMIPDRPGYTLLRQSGSTGYQAPAQRVGHTLVFPCSQGYDPGTVTFTCSPDGIFRSTDRCTKVT